jgi:UDP-GlcNAc:undecaprenyl-phosphate GlcNAc-1-phosphate transferase
VFPGDFLLVGWIMVCINALKWVGGSPGLIESNSLIAFIMLYILGIRTFSGFVSANSIFIVGALLGFLIYAFPPQKIFSGTSGKALYGFIIAVFAIINGAKFASTLMIIMLPLIDFTYVLIKRMIKHKQFNIFKIMRINGPEHLHHQLLALGMSGRQVLLAESSVTLLVGSIAILTTGAIKLFLLVLCAFLLFAGVLWVNLYRQKQDRLKAARGDGDSPEGKYAY